MAEAAQEWNTSHIEGINHTTSLRNEKNAYTSTSTSQAMYKSRRRMSGAAADDIREIHECHEYSLMLDDIQKVLNVTTARHEHYQCHNCSARTISRLLRMHHVTIPGNL